MIAGRRTYADKFVDLISTQDLALSFPRRAGHFTYAFTRRPGSSITAYDGSDALDANIATFGDSTERERQRRHVPIRLGQQRHRRDAVEAGRVARPAWARRAGCWATARRSNSARRCRRFSTVLDLGAGSLTLRNGVSDRRLAGSVTTHTGAHERSFGYDAASYGIDYEATSPQSDARLYDLHQSPTVRRRCTSTTCGARRRHG